MLKRRFLVTIAALTLLISAVNGLSAQQVEGLSFGPSARPFPKSGPLIKGGNFFDYDAQLWAPYDVTSLDGHVPANTGFFFAFDFSYMSLSRPGVVQGQDPRNFATGNKWHWGRTYSFGYMDETGNGCEISWLNLDGGSDFVVGQDVLITQPMALNLKYNTVQINRTFRQALSNGGYIEPYFGILYTSINDETNQDGLIGVSNNRFKQRVSNSAVGGQVGGRYFKRNGRATIETNLGLGAMYNSQSYYSTDITTTANVFTISENTNENQTFVPALNLALKLSYNIVRDVSFRMGGELTYNWEGIARADIRTDFLNPNSLFGPQPFPSTVNSESFIAAGFSWGFDWRR